MALIYKLVQLAGHPVVNGNSIQLNWMRVPNNVSEAPSSPKGLCECFILLFVYESQNTSNSLGYSKVAYLKYSYLIRLNYLTVRTPNIVQNAQRDCIGQRSLEKIVPPTDGHIVTTVACAIANWL